MKTLICLLLTLGLAHGLSLPFRPNCASVFCTMDVKICPDGRPAPVPVGGCCPSLSACFTTEIISPIVLPDKCAFTFCTMVAQFCPDGTPAPIPAGECCPSLKACASLISNSRSNPLGSLLSGGNLLQTLSTATHGTDLGTVISMLNLLNNIQQLSNDVHHIPLLINQTLTSLINASGQASQIVIDQLVGAIKPHAASRDLLGALGQNANLLSSIGHLLPQGTSITTIISILNLLNNINALNQDIHQVPLLLNQTLQSIFNGAGQAGQVVAQQLLALVGVHSGTSRDLLGALGQNANLLSSIGHLLPQGTSITTIISILNLLNNINALNQDIHQVPLLLNQTLQSIFNGAGQAGQVVAQQLLALVGVHPQAGSRDLLGALGQNANLLSTISHLLPQGTSISTVISLLNLLNNVNALNTDIHQIPTLLQETIQNLLNGVQNLLPPTIQPVQGSA